MIIDKATYGRDHQELLTENADFLREYGWGRLIFIKPGALYYDFGHIQEYLKKVHINDLHQLCELMEQDWWHGILESVDYFRECFGVDWSIEVMACCEVPGSMDMCYSYYYNLDDWELRDSTMLVRKDLLREPHMPNLVLGLVAHEIWHVRQCRDAYVWTQANLTPQFDLRELDPCQPNARSALYNLGLLFYDLESSNRTDNLIEYEADYVKNTIEAMAKSKVG